MHWSQSVRAKLLEPFLKKMCRWQIRPNHLTWLGLFFGLLFPPFFLAGWYELSLIALLIHVLLDGIDGPLARYTHQASNRGSFTDSMADQLVVAASTITLIHAQIVSPWAGGSYLFFYTVVVLFAFARNALASPYSWLFRPRFLIFIWIGVELWIWPGSISFVLWISSVILTIKSISGFVAIRRRL